MVKEGEVGIFWIAWEDIQEFFGCIYSSWSPARFSCRRDVHGVWKRPLGPFGHLDDNPQYILRVSASMDTVVWLLLFPHYPPQPPVIEAGGVRTQPPTPRLALHTFKGNRKAYYVADELVKSPWKVEYCAHYASVRLTCPRGEQAFVVVVAADRGLRSSSANGGGAGGAGGLAYTLTCYSTEPSGIYTALDSPSIEMRPQGEQERAKEAQELADAELARKLQRDENNLVDGRDVVVVNTSGVFSKTFRYKWTAESAGGALGQETFGRNPMFRLDSDVAQRVFIKLRCEAKEVQVAIHLFSSGQRVSCKDKDSEQKPSAGRFS